MFWWIPAGLAARLPLQPVPAAAVVGAPASVSVAHDGTVWIAGDRGVVRLGGAPRSWEVDRALAVCLDARGDAWAGTRGGVVLLGDDGPSPVAGATGEGYHLPVGPGGDCWVTPQDGVAGPLRRGDGGAGVLPVAVPAGVEVVALARDGGGRWWLGSSDGLYELQSDAVREVPGTRGSKAFPLRPQGDVMWVGTGDGVLRVRGDDVSRPLAGQYVTGVAATPEATFVGTAEGALLRLGADGSGAVVVGQGPPQALFDLEVGAGGWLWGGHLGRGPRAVRRRRPHARGVRSRRRPAERGGPGPGDRSRGHVVDHHRARRHPPRAPGRRAVGRRPARQRRGRAAPRRGSHAVGGHGGGPRADRPRRRAGVAGARGSRRWSAASTAAGGRAAPSSAAASPRGTRPDRAR
jgi:hypothetical protein